MALFSSEKGAVKLAPFDKKGSWPGEMEKSAVKPEKNLVNAESASWQ